MKKNRNIQQPAFCCEPKRHDDELPVLGNLAVTPAEMMRMSEQGLPVTNQNMNYLNDPVQKEPSWELPLDALRGVDPATMWEESQCIKQRAKAAHFNDRKRYGDNFVKDE